MSYRLAPAPFTRLHLVCAAIVLPLLSGCALLDPAPYQPAGTLATTKGAPPPNMSPDACPAIGPDTASNAGLLQFSDFQDASAKLCVLGAAYALHRNNLMRERLALDLPAIGLGVAGAANGVFNGAKDLTLALGIGSAGLAGGSAYFSPGTRITAYNAAAQSLLCASSISHQMAIEDDADGTAAARLLTDIGTNIKAATDMIENGVTTSVTQAQVKDLMTARDAATKSLSTLATANQLLVAGPRHLEAFASQVMGNATSKVVSGAQNADAALSLIKAQISGGQSTGAPAGGSTHPLVTMTRRTGSPAAPAPPPPPSAAQTIADLDQEASDADAMTGRINDAWSKFSTCSAS